jgi:Fe-S oxidoreductase
MLWPDTFTNFLIPEPGRAAVEVLEAAGYEVTMPTRPLCCGRPLYAAGMLPTAKKLWRQILDSLAPAIRDGVPLVGVEPSCVAAFRDELVNLFPKDEDARRLAKQTFMLSEFLVKEGYEPPRLARKALVHFHCNHHAVMGKEAENTLLQKLGLDFHDLNAGCCGMAGPFGFEDEHYALSIQCGERVLLPAVREASRDTLIITDGFSCREQIAQETNRKALNVAQVLRLALREDGAIPPEVEPASRPASAVSARTAAAVACGLGAGLIAGSWWLSTHRRS